MNAGDVPVLGLPLEFKIAGTGHDRRYTSVRRYAAKGTEVRLIPEPTNPVDKHAIAVHMQWLSASGKEHWDQIGYVPAEFSRFVGELIANGEWAIEAVFIRRLDTSPELDAPRVMIRIEGKDLRPDRLKPLGENR